MKIIPFITILSLVIVIPIASAIYIKFTRSSYHYFSEQSYSFLQGRLDIASSFDTILYNNKNYLAKDPFPAFLIVPVMYVFGPNINESHLQIFLVILLGFAVYRLSRIQTFNKKDSLYLTYAFLGGSIMIAIISKPTFYTFAEVISSLLLVLVVTEYLTRKNYLYMGCLIASIIATRFSAGFILFPILFTLFTQEKTEKVKKILQISIPILFSLSIMAAFNYFRFNSFFVDVSMVRNAEWLVPLRARGIVSLVHLPTNFYFYFLSGLQPVFEKKTYLLTFPYITCHYLGTSFFIISPIFLLAFRSLKNKVLQIRLLWLTCFVTVFFLLCFYSTGTDQFGPRYMADLLPILFYLLLISFEQRRLRNWHKALICFSAVLNTYLLLSVFFITP